MTSAYLLHAIFLCALPLTFFGATYAFLRQKALAAVVALCVGFYTHPHGSGGWDYHNTASGPLYLATLWVGVLPSSLRGNATTLAFAGALAALAAHTNITLVNLFPALIYLHLAASRVETGRWPDRRTPITRTGWTLVGALAATAVLGFINWLVGRDFLSFAQLIRKVGRFLSGSPHIAGRPLSDFQWVLTSGYLALLAAVFVSGFVFLLVERRITPDDNRRPRALVIQFLGATMLWIGWQTLDQPGSRVSRGTLPARCRR
jgi:hypothetical protein